jgi:hypothetical protein
MKENSLTEVAYFSKAYSAVNDASVKFSYPACQCRCRQGFNNNKDGLSSIAILFVFCLTKTNKLNVQYWYNTDVSIWQCNDCEF